MSTDTINTSRKTLKNLVQILHDGRDGFKNASEGVMDPQLKSLFGRFALQRSEFAGELEEELRNLGEKDPQDEGHTLTGTAHRVWIDLKLALTRHDAHSVLEEAERGEDAAKSAYKDALDEKDLPAPLRDVISRQAAEVQDTHDEVKRLRDATKN